MSNTQYGNAFLNRYNFMLNCVLLTSPAETESAKEERRAELFVECTLYIDGAPFGLPTRTRFYMNSFCAFHSQE